jgi:peroxiredoxin
MRLITLIALCSAGLFAAGELSGRRAPSFSLPDAQGRQHDILDYRGKVLIIDFMKTNCPHCQTLSGVLENLKQQYGDKVAVLSVVNYPEDSPQTVAAYVAQRKMKTPVLFDCGSVAVAYMKTTSFSTPHVFVIDANGTIRNDYSYGPMTASIFEGKGLSVEVDKLLK